MGLCTWGLKWYQENHYRFLSNLNGLSKGPGPSNGGGSVSGVAEWFTTEGNKRVEKGIEGPRPS